MARCIMLLGLLCGCFAFAQTARAQGLWFGGFGPGPGIYGTGIYGSSFYSYGVGGPGFSPGSPGFGWGYPVGVRRAYAPRPVVAVGPVVGRPVYAARPAVGVPLGRAYRRVYRRGW